MQVSQIDRGAFIGEFSQYEAEEEHVLPPLSHFEILSKTRKFNVNVYRLKINCNLRAQTLEEIRGNRRSTVLDLAQKLNQEFQELMDREAREIAKILAGSVDPVGPEYFNQGDHFSEIISKLEKAFVKELEEAAAALHESAKANRRERGRRTVWPNCACGSRSADGAVKTTQRGSRQCWRRTRIWWQPS